MSSELKTQFLNYMTLQRFSDHTKRSYVTGVKLLSKYYMQSPDTLTNDQIQDYIRYLLEERKLSWGTCNAYLSGLTILLANRFQISLPSRTPADVPFPNPTQERSIIVVVFGSKLTFLAITHFQVLFLIW